MTFVLGERTVAYQTVDPVVDGLDAYGVLAFFYKVGDIYTLRCSPFSSGIFAVDIYLCHNADLACVYEHSFILRQSFEFERCLIVDCSGKMSHCFVIPLAEILDLFDFDCFSGPRRPFSKADLPGSVEVCRVTGSESSCRFLSANPFRIR